MGKLLEKSTRLLFSFLVQKQRLPILSLGGELLKLEPKASSRSS